MPSKLQPNDKKLMGEFETLCKFHTPIDVIAMEFGVHKDTLKTWVFLTYKEEFKFVYQRFMNRGCNDLNKSSLALANKDAKMNIWLRKQWLKESDPDKSTNKIEEADFEDLSPLSELLK